MKSSDNPTRTVNWRAHLLLAHACPRCGAKTRRGTSCQGPAMRGRRRCRMHGGQAGAPCGPGNGMFRHGLRTIEVIEQRRATALLIREYRRILRELGTNKSVT
jgi:hypothetical protein